MANNGTISPKRIHGYKVDTKRICKGIARGYNKSGNSAHPCKLSPMVDSDFCPYHDSSTKDQINQKHRQKRRAK